MRRVGVGAEKSDKKNAADTKLKKKVEELKAENEQLKAENAKLLEENEQLKAEKPKK